MDNEKMEKVAKRIATAKEATVIYSAILIDESDKAKLLADSIHPNKYGEHVTLHYFGNNGGTDTPYAGTRVELTLKKHYSDDRGDAWTVECDDASVNEIKDDAQTLHITVSCADGTKPVYSNQLIKSSKPDDREGFTVHGRIAYYMTNRNWIVK